jgi:hypothetical protein
MHTGEHTFSFILLLLALFQNFGYVSLFRVLFSFPLDFNVVSSFKDFEGEFQRQFPIIKRLIPGRLMFAF